VSSETRFVRNGDFRVAYRTIGDGPRDIVFVSNWATNCELFPELPVARAWCDAMTTLGRVIYFDQPGTGVSDSVTLDALPTLEQWTDSITVVLDELESSEAVLVAVDGAFATAALFAAMHPTRTSALIVLEGSAYPPLADAPPEVNDEMTAAFVAMWGTGESQHITNPEMPWNEEVRAAFARYERLSATPTAMEQLMPLVAQLDVRDILPSIRVPTLVLHNVADAIYPVESGRYIAENIPGAELVEFPGRNLYLFVDPDWRRCFEEISEFLTGSRAATDDDTVLATVLFTDIVDSTRRAADMGDRAWRTLLDAHDAVVRAELARFRGRDLGTAGDSFLATFDGPQRAIRCAMAIREAVKTLDLEVRAGLHTGECELRGEGIGGIAVHIGARVCHLAGANEVLVSGTLRDLVVGSGLQFDDRGIHELKGVPGEWRLFAVADSQS
jgi:class 3 adenylate cyclase/pimeloyl-ACP methyl ester carboxylesterase